MSSAMIETTTSSSTMVKPAARAPVRDRFMGNLRVDELPLWRGAGDSGEIAAIGAADSRISRLSEHTHGCPNRA
jgi:hypothetical protein